MTGTRIRRWLAGLLLMAGVAVGGWWWTRPQPSTVTVHVVERGRVERSVANTRAGTISPRRRARLAPLVGGRVRYLAVAEGDRVAADQLLLELWNDDLRAELLLAERERERATAAAAVRRLQAELAEREAQRLRALQQSQILSEERLDRAQTTAEAACAEAASAAADVLVAAARIETVRAALEKTMLRAPFAGVVAEVHAEIGEFVTPSPFGIATLPAVDLVDDASAYVTVPVDEIDAADVRPGLSATITFDAFGTRGFAGRVRRIAPYVLEREKQARTIDVIVDLVDPPPDVRLLTGYSADASILVDAVDDVLTVPAEALRDDGTVLVVAADGSVAQRRVVLGMTNWRRSEVRSGLAAGDRVVTSSERGIVHAGDRVLVRDTGREMP